MTHSPYVALPARPLYEVLGHLFSKSETGAARTVLLNRLFAGLSPLDQLRCRSAMLAARAKA